MIAALADEGIAARSRADEGRDFTGVWVDERKIGSIGVHVQKGVATHGFAVNVQNDLQPFEWVVPCGLEGVRMTSVLREQARGGDPLACFRKRMAWRFAEAFGRRQRLVSPRARRRGGPPVHRQRLAATPARRFGRWPLAPPRRPPRAPARRARGRRPAPAGAAHRGAAHARGLRRHAHRRRRRAQRRPAADAGEAHALPPLARRGRERRRRRARAAEGPAPAPRPRVAPQATLSVPPARRRDAGGCSPARARAAPPSCAWSSSRPRPRRRRRRPLRPTRRRASSRGPTRRSSCRARPRPRAAGARPPRPRQRPRLRPRHARGRRARRRVHGHVRRRAHRLDRRRRHLLPAAAERRDRLALRRHVPRRADDHGRARPAVPRRAQHAGRAGRLVPDDALPRHARVPERLRDRRRTGGSGRTSRSSTATRSGCSGRAWSPSPPRSRSTASSSRPTTPHFAPQSTLDVPSLPGQWWGAAFADDAPHTYVFGIRDAPRSVFLRAHAAAETSTAPGSTAPRPGGAARSRTRSPSSTTPAPPTQISVIPDGAGWALVSQEPLGSKSTSGASTDLVSWGAPELLTTIPVLGDVQRAGPSRDDGGRRAPPLLQRQRPRHRISCRTPTSTGRASSGPRFPSRPSTASSPGSTAARPAARRTRAAAGARPRAPRRERDRRVDAPRRTAITRWPPAGGRPSAGPASPRRPRARRAEHGADHDRAPAAGRSLASAPRTRRAGPAGAARRWRLPRGARGGPGWRGAGAARRACAPARRGPGRAEPSRRRAPSGRRPRPPVVT